ncbi:MOSC domain-containing protein [Pseudonocardia alaniniphila]|uniref:MOSC domain-containing protein n=2 Tax=Pseudonocardia alaniniphila TaxID=75291 RepID=A0ABS9TTV2_9PSEU|nr:MOSC domain-containing protein [Pseudonocardia alaniniphila]MCH6172005.1 MOSC domain-containing protein [Pseudonocardia alaniniphila]
MTDLHHRTATGDTYGHGGEQRAVLVYRIQSYQHRQQHFGPADFSFGQFGQDLTVDGLPDDEVCIGKRYRIGEAEFEGRCPSCGTDRAGHPAAGHLLPGRPTPGRARHTRTAGRSPPTRWVSRTRRSE